LTGSFRPWLPTIHYILYSICIMSHVTSHHEDMKTRRHEEWRPQHGERIMGNRAPHHLIIPSSHHAIPSSHHPIISSSHHPRRHEPETPRLSRLNLLTVSCPRLYLTVFWALLSLLPRLLTSLRVMQALCVCLSANAQ
jgi:hypothetical protein